MGEEDDAKINNLFNILNDLEKGKKVMMDLMRKLAKNSLEGPMNQNRNGDGGSNNGEGRHSCTTMQSHPHLYTKSPRPTNGCPICNKNSQLNCQPGVSKLRVVALYLPR